MLTAVYRPAPTGWRWRLVLGGELRIRHEHPSRHDFASVTLNLRAAPKRGQAVPDGQSR